MYSAENRSKKQHSAFPFVAPSKLYHLPRVGLTIVVVVVIRVSLSRLDVNTYRMELELCPRMCRRGEEEKKVVFAPKQNDSCNTTQMCLFLRFPGFQDDMGIRYR